MTPVTYIAGRAYHDGWYDRLHLDQSMFPLDTAGMLTEGAIAIEDGFGKVATAALQAVGNHWFVVLLIVVGGGLIWAALAPIFQKLDEDRADRKKALPKRHRPILRWLSMSALPRIALVSIFGFAIYECIAAVTLVFTLLTLPFVQLGSYEAGLAVSKDFKESPMVTVKSPKGDVQRREIGCGPAFCALWGDRHASYAPVSAITWADSPSPSK